MQILHDREVHMDALSDSIVIAESLDIPDRFGIIFDRHYQEIFRYAGRRIPREPAKDVTSEVFQTAFTQRSSYDLTRTDARPWLYGIAVNTMRRYFRSSNQHERRVARAAAHAGGFEVQVEPVAGVDAALDAVRVWPEVARAINCLSIIDREALLLLVWEELTYPEISVALGVPIGTVRSRINRARVQLREMMGLAPSQSPYESRDEQDKENEL